MSGRMCSRCGFVAHHNSRRCFAVEVVRDEVRESGFPNFKSTDAAKAWWRALDERAVATFRKLRAIVERVGAPLPERPRLIDLPTRRAKA